MPELPVLPELPELPGGPELPALFFRTWDWDTAGFVTTLLLLL